jgi:sugar/nucleoside kinase (ribokinase family)
MGRSRICVIGSSNVDLIARVPRLPRLGETLAGRSFHVGYGGKGANQAVMAARLGARVTMVSRVGRDLFGDGVLRNYREQGVDATHVLVDEARFTGVAPILVDDAARNVIVIVPGANLGLSPDDVRRAAPAICGADVVVCQCEVPVEATLEALRTARSAGVRTILNPAPAVPLPGEVFRVVDVCVPNEPEVARRGGDAGRPGCDSRRDRQHHARARRARGRGRPHWRRRRVHREPRGVPRGRCFHAGRGPAGQRRRRAFRDDHRRAGVLSDPGRGGRVPRAAGARMTADDGGASRARARRAAAATAVEGRP